MADPVVAPPAPVTLFISYARADQPRAAALAQALEAGGYRVWWDRLIEGGQAYATSIEEQLEKADAVLVLWSANSVASDWVRDEAALARDRRRLVPLSLDGSAAPIGFRQYQSIALARRKAPNAAELAEIERAIATVAGRERRLPLSGPATSRRGLLITGAGAGALALAGAGWLVWRGGGAGGAAKLPSIAVLPFRNLSGDETQAFFADGLTDEIRAALARIDGLQVLAGTSSETARDHEGDARQTAKKLGVDFLLEGSVRRAGNLVRIAANLADGDTGFDRWSSTLTRGLNDIFAVQSEIARTVAGAMSVTLETDQPEPGGTRNFTAFENFLQGRALFNLAKDEETDRAAIAKFDAAIAEDPNFAMAYAARARAFSAFAAEHADASELKSLSDRAIADATRAIQIAPTLPQGQLALGFALFNGRLDIAGAAPYYERAYRLGRGDADVVLVCALYWSRAGKAQQAKEAVERAVLLDPLNARAHRAQGSVAYAARQYEAALPPLRRALELNPKMSFAPSLVGLSLLGLNRLPEAKAAMLTEPGDLFRLSGLAIIERRLGNAKAAERAFSQLKNDVGDSALYQQAQVLSQWGRLDDAIETLERARAVGDSGLIYLATDPLLDPLRQQPRFTALLNGLKRS